MNRTILFIVTGVILIYPFLFLLVPFSTNIIENEIVVGTSHRSLLNLYFEVQDDYGIPAIFLLTIPHMVFLSVLLVKEQMSSHHIFKSVEGKQ